MWYAIANYIVYMYFDERNDTACHLPAALLNSALIYLDNKSLLDVFLNEL